MNIAAAEFIVQCLAVLVAILKLFYMIYMDIKKK